MFDLVMLYSVGILARANEGQLEWMLEQTKQLTPPVDVISRGTDAEISNSASDPRMVLVERDESQRWNESCFSELCRAELYQSGVGRYPKEEGPSAMEHNERNGVGWEVSYVGM